MPAIQGLIPDRKRVFQIALIYKDAEKYIMNKIFSIDVMNYTDEKASKIKRDIKKKTTELDLRIVQWSNLSIPESYNISKKLGESKMKRYDIKKDPRFNEARHTKTIDKIIDLTENIYFKANKSINIQIGIYLNLLKRANSLLTNAKIQELGTADQAIINDIITSGLAAQKTLTQISLDVFRYFQDQFGKGAFIRVKGRNYTMSSYSKKVARTQMRIIQTQATKNIAKQYNNDLIKVSDHNTTSEICIPFEGNIYSISGENDIYPELTEDTPYHPNCEHYMDPYPDVLALRG